MIVVVEYGMGNLGSILNMLKKVGAEAKSSSRAKDILSADKLILPGVGSFDHGMEHLNNLNLIEPLNRAASEQGKPILGICLGAQLLTQGSEEGHLPGLGWLDATTVRIKADALKVPHMGWNIARPLKPSALFQDLPIPARFYFVHSYHMVCGNPADSLCQTPYGMEFTSGIERDNLVGLQFHPEKSHKFGMILMRNFAERFSNA